MKKLLKIPLKLDNSLIFGNCLKFGKKSYYLPWLKLYIRKYRIKVPLVL